MNKHSFFQIDDNLKPQLRLSIKNYYEGDHAMDAISVLWNAIMLKVNPSVSNNQSQSLSVHHYAYQ